MTGTGGHTRDHDFMNDVNDIISRNVPEHLKDVRLINYLSY